MWVFEAGRLKRRQTSQCWNTCMTQDWYKLMTTDVLEAGHQSPDLKNVMLFIGQQDQRWFFVHEIICQIIRKLFFRPRVKFFKCFQEYVSFIVKKSLTKNNKLEFNDNEIKVSVKCT